MGTEQVVQSETGARVDAIAEWRSWLAGIAGILLLYASLSGFAVYLLPFSEFAQVNVLLHTGMSAILVAPVTWYAIRHWRTRRRGNLSHHQLLGYIAVVLLLVCLVSGFVLLWQGMVGPRAERVWSLTHLLTGAGTLMFLVLHLTTVVVRRVRNEQAVRTLRRARWVYYRRSAVGTAALLGLTAVWAAAYEGPATRRAFPADYNWRFGKDRPFAPSLARVSEVAWSDTLRVRAPLLFEPEDRRELHERLDAARARSVGPFRSLREYAADVGLADAQMQRLEGLLEEASNRIRDRGAIEPRALTGSEGCGTDGCHSEIYDEWLPSAHRYSSLDDMFQRVQTIMVEETSPEHTRYCAGCHDPISLFGGAKNASNVTLSAEGSHEGISCLTCHSIVQTDVQGNGDYTIEPARRYMYEYGQGRTSKLLSDFLLRTYPENHISSYSRPLYKTAEFCAACHKQYIDREVNTDIGKVQGQNQYDSWKNSRWHREGDPRASITCRECHMPLVPSTDPARGDATDYNRSLTDGAHRSHRTLASNQYIPLLHDLEGAEEHTRLTEAWLRGEIDIPEISDRWVDGPVVRLEIHAPDSVRAGEDVSVQITLTNNKTGHDFPTGPLDMIESWLEITIRDETGEILHHSGGLQDDDSVGASRVVFKSDGFDREGRLIDRHNLWDLVGASYKRSMYPGVTDSVQVEFQCPSMARGRLTNRGRDAPPGRRAENYTLRTGNDVDSLTVEAVLWYRKANPEFLERVYGAAAHVRSRATAMSRATAAIGVRSDGA